MPSPIDDLEAIVARVGDVRRSVAVLDFDGTLAPLVDRPDDARVSPAARQALDVLSQLTDVIVLSARHVDDLVPRLDELPLTLVGGHGTEVLRADGTRTALFDAAPARLLLDDLEHELDDLLDTDLGWHIERKPASIAVHHRGVPEDDVQARLPEVRSAMEARADHGEGWEVIRGRAVIEMRPASVDKGTAIAWLAPRFPGQGMLVLGNDMTDEDGFRAANERGGVTVLVSPEPRPTEARYRIAGPQRVVALLEALGRSTAAPAEVASRRDGVRFHPIREYGMVGDSRTAALISPDASMDWLCLPRFDSPSVFAAILDPERGGRWRISPSVDCDVQRTYLGETNVLVTRFTRDGDPVLTVTDLLVFSRVNAFDPAYTGHTVMRKVEAFDEVEVTIEFQPRFDYGRAHTAIDVVDGGLRAAAGADHLDLRAPGIDFEVAPHEDGNGDVATATLRLAAGEERWLKLLTKGSERGPHAHLADPELLELTVRTWGRWARMIDYEGPWRDEVIRSALVLKGLVYEPTGALVAAPTTSLPEGIGGERNWDYRYAWIRDSAYVLECFLRIGHTREAETFIRWLSELTDRIGGAHALQPLYRVTGEEDLAEFELDHLAGYRGSRPVRVGNGAATQLQLDIYGAAMQLGYLTEQLGGEIPAARWPVIRELVETVTEKWDQPDAGLWEIRSAPRHHTFSKFQCWLAVDRAIRIGRDLGLKAPYGEWQRTADDIRDSILEHGYDEELGAFTQAYGSKALDASILLLPLKGFLPPSDPRVRSTVTAIRDSLEVADGLLLRYRTEDGLSGHEGAFLLCSYWLIELLARMGELDEAIRLFERLRGFAGPLGLYAEEIDPRTHAHLGNFPQAFTHMGLIAAATAIDEELRNRSR